MIVDTFLYCGERDWLDLRMRELQDTVDLFVAVEGTLTFQGKPRRIAAGLPRQSNFTHLIVSDFPEANPRNAWKREMWQRNAILRALQGLQNDDLIMVSDVDEIPDAQLVPTYLAQGEIYRFKQELYLYNFNNHVVNDSSAQLGWNNTTICRLDDLRRYYPQGVRNMVEKVVILNGGWHFSFFGDIHDKLTAYSHTELLEMSGTFEQRIQERWSYRFEQVEGMAHLPQGILEDLRRYGKYFAKELM